MAEIRILYDGWPLVYSPNSPAALHLLCVLSIHPREYATLVALPGTLAYPLPDGVGMIQGQAAESGWGRLTWEQRTLPALARRSGARLIHLIGGAPPLFGDRPAVVSPAWHAEPGEDIQAVDHLEENGPKRDLGTRLRLAAGQGGMARLSALLWPEILPASAPTPPLMRLPPVVHPVFLGPLSIRHPAPRLEGYALPEAYTLYHGPHAPYALRQVLESWSWAAGSLGQDVSLLLIGLGEAARDTLPRLAAEYRVEKSVGVLPVLPVHQLAELYRGCSAVFHPAESAPWSGALHLALAAGRPLVGLDTPRNDAWVGPAGYLVPLKDGRADSRGLGAALITLLLEEVMAERMAQAAWGRAQTWQAAVYTARLAEVYAALTS